MKFTKKRDVYFVAVNMRRCENVCVRAARLMIKCERVSIGQNVG